MTDGTHRSMKRGQTSCNITMGDFSVWCKELGNHWIINCSFRQVTLPLSHTDAEGKSREIKRSLRKIWSFLTKLNKAVLANQRALSFCLNGVIITWVGMQKRFCPGFYSFLPLNHKKKPSFNYSVSKRHPEQGWKGIIYFHLVKSYSSEAVNYLYCLCTDIFANVHFLQLYSQRLYPPVTIESVA